MVQNKWITLALLGFIFYSVYNSKVGKLQEASNTQPKVEKIDNEKIKEVPDIQVKAGENNSFLEKKITNIINNTLNSPTGKEFLYNVLTPKITEYSEKKGINEYYSNLIMVDRIYGKGAKATCGQKVKIIYQDLNNSPHPITVDTYLGENAIDENIQIAVIDMQKGGVKEIEVKSSNPQETASKKYKVELIELQELPKSRGKFQVFNSPNNVLSLAVCGQEAKIHYSISNIMGEEIYNSRINNEPTTVIIGDPNIPIGITNALNNYEKPGVRTVLMPQEWLNAPSFFPKNIKFPRGEMLIFNIEVL